MLLPSALQGFVICFRYESEPRSKVHSLQWQSYTEHTHMHTLFGPYIAYWDACVPLIACKASSCSTYTHSFPLPAPISSPLNGPWGLELSLRLSRTFSSSCFPVWIPLISLWISPSLACSCIDHPIFAHHLLSLYLTLVSPGEGRKRKEAVLTRVQQPEAFPHLNFITNKAGHFTRRRSREENENTKELKGLWFSQ